MTKPLFCKKSRPEELAISLILRGSGKPVDGLAPRHGAPMGFSITLMKTGALMKTGVLGKLPT
jgi:hypothetical protein